MYVCIYGCSDAWMQGCINGWMYVWAPKKVCIKIETYYNYFQWRRSFLSFCDLLYLRDHEWLGNYGFAKELLQLFPQLKSGNDTWSMGFWLNTTSTLHLDHPGPLSGFTSTSPGAILPFTRTCPNRMAHCLPQTSIIFPHLQIPMAHRWSKRPNSKGGNLNISIYYAFNETCLPRNEVRTIIAKGI